MGGATLTISRLSLTVSGDVRCFDFGLVVSLHDL